MTWALLWLGLGATTVVYACLDSPYVGWRRWDVALMVLVLVSGPLAALGIVWFYRRVR